MKSSKIYLSILFLMLFVVSFFVLDTGIAPEPMLELSVITPGKNRENLEGLKMGMDQAASDYRVNINFITLAEENDPQEQVALLERELAEDVDAILIAPADETLLAPVIGGAKRPIVTFDSAVPQAKVLAHLEPDHYFMGTELGKAVFSAGNTRAKIALLSGKNQSSALRLRYNGIVDSLAQSKNQITSVIIDDVSPKEMQSTLYRLMNYDVLIALDTATLDYVVDMVGSYRGFHIFGFGNSVKIVSKLEKGEIHTIAVQNDFALGYLSVESAALKLRGKKSSRNIQIETSCVSNETMYDQENQRLLFPFVR